MIYWVMGIISDTLFQVLHHSAGYGLTYPAWHKFYDITKADEVKAMTKNSFAVHYWNAMSKKKKILLDPEHPLYQIFQSNCPLTEKSMLQPMIGKPY